MNTNGRIILMGVWLLIGVLLFAWEWKVGSAWILGGFARPTPTYEEVSLSASMIDSIAKKKNRRKQ